MGSTILAKKRKGNIEFLRFIFAFGIMLHHISAFYPKMNFIGGYIGVDFFFMISGAFLAKSVSIHKESYAKESFKITFSASRNYIKRRILSVFPYFVLSTIIGYAVCFVATGSVISPLYIINDFAFLIEFGFDAPSATGTTWFLSALFISLFLLYPIIRHYYEYYVRYIGVFVSLFIYGFLVYNYGMIGLSNEHIATFINAGVLRAIAGLSFGAIAFELSLIIISKVNNNKIIQIAISFAEFVLVILEFYLMHFDNRKLDQIEVFIIFSLITLLFSNKSHLCRVFENNFSRFLGKFSIVLFMNHFYWAKYLDSIIIKFQISFLSEWYYRVIVVVLLSIATSIIVYLLICLYKFLMHSNRRRGKDKQCLT